MTAFSIEELLKDVKAVEKAASEKATKIAEEDSKKEKDTDYDKKDSGEVGSEVKKENKEEAKKEEVKDDKKQDSDSPVDDAMKMAEKLASLEKEALVKEAELIGKAIADGAYSRFQQLEKAAMANLDQEKIAHLYENDAEFRQSFDQGYMDKVAAELESNPEAKKAFIEGYEKTANEFIKVGSFLRDKGYVEAANVMSKIAAKK